MTSAATVLYRSTTSSVRWRSDGRGATAPASTTPTTATHVRGRWASIARIAEPFLSARGLNHTTMSNGHRRAPLVVLLLAFIAAIVAAGSWAGGSSSCGSARGGRGGDRRPRTRVYCNEVGTKHLAALFVVLSLMAPPLVGLACVWACAVGAPHSIAAGHDHAGMNMAGPTLSGHHACAHDVGTVELFSPTAERRPAPLDFVTEIAPRSIPQARAGLPPALSGPGPLEERALHLPGFSPVLRI